MTSDVNRSNVVTTEESSNNTTNSTSSKGIAGRTNYSQWDKITTELVKEVEEQDKHETEQEKAKLGLDGKYAYSQAEADERLKLQKAKNTKKTLEKFKKRESQFIQSIPGLLGPSPVDDDDDINNNNEDKQKTSVDIAEETKMMEGQTVRITRDMVDAGKRVVSICDTAGASMNTDTIVLTLDLSHIESKMATNALLTPKSYKDDAENNPEPEKPPTVTDYNGDTNQEDKPIEKEEYRKILGLIKVFITNVHNCTILIKCKIITGSLEIHHCSNIRVKIESTATVATIQADLSRDVLIEFWDAPSGKNIPGTQPPMYWGDDKDDRIFHAGMTNMKVSVYRDGYIENEIICDYIKDGAEMIGNATAEEYQFVTSFVNGQLVNEKVNRAGASTGTNVRAMTERELQEEKLKREKAASMAVQMAEDMIQVKDKDGNVICKKTEPTEKVDDEAIEEVYSSMNREQINQIIEECNVLKTRGNEAFAAGEYVQAILHYSLSIDKSYELPDYDVFSKKLQDGVKEIYPRDILLSNRAACFLKLGQHDKAEADAKLALSYNPNNIKATFRLGLSLHAQNKYYEALPILVKANRLEPHNKQIKQALQFCEVRLEQERRKMMDK